MGVLNSVYSGLLGCFKKELMLDGVITPIANNRDTQKIIINFTALKSFDFSDSTIFPYKSTWITPRFDS